MAEGWLWSHRLVLVIVALVSQLVGGVTIVAIRASDTDRDFVTRDGTVLQVDGAPFRFVGVNIYDAAASDVYACSPTTRLDDGELADAMRTVRDAGGTVVRFWAYQSYTAGGTDFSGVDRVLAAARAEHLRVLPVLEDGPGNCSTGTPRLPLSEADDGTWYTVGYREPYGTADLSYREYAAVVARHYQDDPTIVGWSLMNEAETNRRDGEGRSELVGFARDMAAVVHGADPHHLVTLGTQGNGAPGASGADFTAIYEQPGMDFTEVHDWGNYGSDTEALPGADADGHLPDPDSCGSTTALIGCSFALARRLDKPIVVGEAGITATTPAERERRAALFAAKLDAAFAAGASGYLLWQLNTANTDGYGILLGSRDPLLDAVNRQAERLHPAG